MTDETTDTTVNNILDSIKKMLGIDNSNYFDTDIIIHINSALSSLKQLGAPLTIDQMEIDTTTKWSDIFKKEQVGNIKTFIYLKVKMLFDPPSSSTLLQCWVDNIREYEWRINTMFENTGGDANVGNSE